MMLPHQLNNQRFILTHGKIPFEDKWQSLNNYPIDDAILKQHLSQEPTYGIICGINNLIVIDFDDAAVQALIEPLLPETFKVTTAGKGLTHAYYFTDDTITTRIIEPPTADRKRGRTLLDIQGNHTMVVGPNSTLQNGKTYLITHDAQIATIHKRDLLALITKTLTSAKIKHTAISIEKKSAKNDADIFQSPEVIKIKSLLKPMQLLERIGVPIYKNPTECPFHDSEAKKCLHVTDELWHCFHCGKGGDVITLYQLFYNLTFKDSVNQLFKELQIDEQKYEDAQKNIAINIRIRKITKINLIDIDNIAKLLIRQYNFTTLEETDRIYYYDDDTGTYKPNGEYIIASEIEKYYNTLIKSNVANEIINKIKRLTHQPLAIFDAHKNLICVKNGVFNLETKMLIPHNPQYYFLNYIPVSYNELATCSKTVKFCKEIVAPDDYDLLMEIFGFVLCKDYDIQKAIILVGGGANGKSVFLYVLKALIGNDNISAESLQQLTEDSFSASQLFGKLANISADINSAIVTESGMLKDLTSGTDTISAQFKFQNKFRFINYAKLLFSCNTIPASKDLTHGYMRRWIIIKFPNTFEGPADDKALKYNLTSDDEMSGLFNIAVSKYYSLKSNGQFSRDESVDEIRENYINLSDPIQVFIDKHLVQDSMAMIMKSELYDRYHTFCKDANLPMSTTISLTKSFNAKNIRFKTKRVRIGESFTTREALQGYCWKEDADKDVIDFRGG